MLHWHRVEHPRSHQLSSPLLSIIYLYILQIIEYSRSTINAYSPLSHELWVPL